MKLLKIYFKTCLSLRYYKTLLLFNSLHIFYLEIRLKINEFFLKLAYKFLDKLLSKVEDENLKELATAFLNKLKNNN